MTKNMNMSFISVKKDETINKKALCYQINAMPAFSQENADEFARRYYSNNLNKLRGLAVGYAAGIANHDDIERLFVMISNLNMKAVDIFVRKYAPYLSNISFKISGFKLVYTDLETEYEAKINLLTKEIESSTRGNIYKFAKIVRAIIVRDNL